MIYNHARVAVWDWDGETESRCPDCGAGLFARRGERVVWHWAHRATLRAPRECLCHETVWHMAWKEAYALYGSWDAEVPVDIGGRRYRLDAANLANHSAREFVHSLSPAYVRKHQDLTESGFDVRWIVDGDEFASSRRRHVARGGLRRPLRPVAAELVENIGPDKVWIHLDACLWRHWRNNVWFVREDDTTTENMRRFRVARDRMEERMESAGRPTQGVS